MGTVIGILKPTSVASCPVPTIFQNPTIGISLMDRLNQQGIAEGRKSQIAISGDVSLQNLELLVCAEDLK